MARKIWIGVFSALALGLAIAFYKSPFVNAHGYFASFERAKAVPAGIIALAGTVIIIIWGWLLLRPEKSQKQEPRQADKDK